MAEQAEAPQGLAACSTFYFTLILIFFDLEPDFTVMVAVPFFFAVITPFAVTVATFLLEGSGTFLTGF